jgi:hypothetical protein
MCGSKYSIVQIGAEMAEYVSVSQDEAYKGSFRFQHICLRVSSFAWTLKKVVVDKICPLKESLAKELYGKIEEIV